MKAGWREQPLREVCVFDPPKSEARKKVRTEEPVSFLPMSSLGFQQWRASSDDVKPLSAVYSGYTYFADGDVLLAKITPCFENGKLGVARELRNGIGFGSSEFMVLRSRGSVLPEYLLYFLSQKHFRTAATAVMTGAVGHKRVPKEWVQAYRVPVPPLPEQQRIVVILDQAFEGIATSMAKAERNMANADSILEQYLSAIFIKAAQQNHSSSIGDVCDRVTVGHVGPMAGEYKENGIPFLRSQNIRPFDLDLSDVKFIDESFDHQLRKSRLAQGDVAIVRTGYPGTAAVIPATLPSANCADLVIARPGRRLDSDYLAAFLNSAVGKALVSGNLNGAAQKHFNVGAAKRALIPLPQTSEQARIAAQIKQMREQSQGLRHLYTRKLALLTELKQSLLARAFSGELTASDALAA